MKKSITLPVYFLIFMLFTITELSLMVLTGEKFIRSQKIMLTGICCACVFRGLRERFVLNPYFCFFLTPFSLLIYNPSVSKRFLTDLDKKVYIAAICSFLLFLAGVELFKPRFSVRRYSYNKHRNFRKDKKKFVKAGLFLASIWVTYKIITDIRGADIPFGAVFKIIAYISMIFLLKSRKIISYVVCLFMAAGMLFSKFTKTAFLYLFLVIILSIFNKKYISKKIMTLGIICLIAGGIFMIFYAYPFKMYFSDNGSFDGMSMKFSDLRQYMEEQSVGFGSVEQSVYVLRPYLSMTTEWTNLNFVMKTQPALTHGMWFIRPVLNMLQIDTSNMAAYALMPRSGYYNTFGFLTIQMKDFGWIGGSVLTFFLGMLTGACYKAFREQTNNAISTVRYVFVAGAVLEMFFSNHFFLGGIHICYFVTWILLCIMRRTHPGLYKAMKR